MIRDPRSPQDADRFRSLSPHSGERAGVKGPTWQDADDLKWAARHWAARIGVRLAQVHVRPMSSKWASMSMAGRLTLDTHLLDLPTDLGEFVIVHELVHLLAPNHGKLFKSYMHTYLPDWEEQEQQLRRQ